MKRKGEIGQSCLNHLDASKNPSSEILIRMDILGVEMKLNIGFIRLFEKPKLFKHLQRKHRSTL